MATPQRGQSTRNQSKQRPPLSAVPVITETPPPTDMPLPPSINREQRIAHCAYLRAAERGFVPGHELEDWLAAERQLQDEGEIDVEQRL